MTCGIYGYLDMTNGQVIYVGKDSHIDKKKRHKAHFTKSRYNEQQINMVLQNNPERYMYVEFISGDFSQNKLDTFEKFFIKIFKKNKECVLNFTEGGDGCCGYCPPQEVRQKISQKLTGRKLSQEHKKHISQSHIGKKLSHQHRNKLSYIKKENVNAQKYNLWDVQKVGYDKIKMIRNNRLPNPCKCFFLKYNAKRIKCGNFLEYISPLIIFNIINEEVK